MKLRLDLMERKLWEQLAIHVLTVDIMNVDF